MAGTTGTQERLGFGQRAARVVGIALAVMVGVFVILVVTDIGGFRGGWLWAPALAAPAMAAAGWWGWGRGRGRLVATVTLALGGIAFGAWNSQEALLSHGRLKAAMDDLSLPANFERTGDYSGGWSLCFDECTSYVRTWLATGDAETVKAQLQQILEDEGFVLKEWSTGRTGLGTATLEGHRGRLRLHVGIDTRRAYTDGRRPELAPGQVGVTAVLDTYYGD